MRERKLLRSRWCLLLLMLPFLASSCSNDSDLTPSNDYCYIKSITLGTVKRNVEKRDRADRTKIITTIYTSFSGNTYAMTINQRDNTIENRDSLPCGSQLSAVLATITFDGSFLVYREKGTDGGWTAYNSTDSLNLTKPLELLLYSNDGKSSRTYTFKVNVHKQEGDSIYWNKCDDNVTALSGMTETKAFVLNDKLMVLGKNTSGIELAERSGIQAEGTWNDAMATGLPITTDVHTLRQQEGTLYLSTTDGSIFSSTDAKTWQQVGISHSAPLTLVEKTQKYFYAISEGKLLRSADATDWSHEEALDTESAKLPVSDIRALTMQQTNGNTCIVMLGQKDEEANASVWNKMWNESEKEEDTEWIYFPLSPDNTIPCPKLKHLNLLSYDGKCMAFGGASSDGSNTHKALDAMYVSQDYGITWRPSDELYLPIQLRDTDGCITSTVDKNHYIWIITNAQVWRGRLNRLGFAQQ